MKVFIQYGLCLAVFLSAIHVVLVRHETRHLFVELQALGRVNDQLYEEWGRLQLEQGTWATSDRIEMFARTKLNMKIPEHNTVVFLEK